MTATTTTDADWAFLDEWFRVLGAMEVAVAGSDGMRVGRTALDAWWLEIYLGQRDLLDPDWEFCDAEDELDDDDSDDGLFDDDARWLQKPAVLERVRELREAIVLTSLVAKTNYDCWLGMMNECTNFRPPSAWSVPVDGVRRDVPVQFQVRLGRKHNAQFFDWNSGLGHFLGDLEYSDQFQSDLERAKDVLARRGIAWTSIEPTRLKVTYAFQSGICTLADVRCRLIRLVGAIQRSRKLEHRARDAGAGSLLKLVDMEIDLVGVDLSTAIIEALTSVLQAGVRVSYLRLPTMRKETASTDSWVTFVRLLTGVDGDDDERLVSVRRIDMPATYAASFHFVPLCSALAYARGVEELIVSGAKHPDGAEVFSWSNQSRGHVWSWLAFAILSNASCTSIQRLVINGERLTVEDVAALQAVVHCHNPLTLLFKAMSQEEAEEDQEDSVHVLESPLPVTIPRRTVFRLSDGRCIADCQNRCDLSGQLVAHHAKSGNASVFIPGYGLCTAYDLEVGRPAKRIRMERPNRSLNSLVLKPEDKASFTNKALEKLLGILGPQLRSLQLEFNLNSATLNVVFRLCPNLENLGLADMKLPSMNVFYSAYTRGARVTCLSLDRMDVPEHATKEFVRQLAHSRAPEGSLQKTLERLFWGSRWPTSSQHATLKLFREVIMRNTTLTHVSGGYFGFFGPSAREVRRLNDLNGDIVPGHSRADKRRVGAFLCAARSSPFTSVREMQGPVLERI